MLQLSQMSSMNRNKFRALLISGSTRLPSYTRTLAQFVENNLVSLGLHTRHWDLRSQPLPITDPTYHHDPTLTPDLRVQEFVAAADSSDAFVLASPIYHNSFSGVLKNALDTLTIKQFQYKPVSLISFGGARSSQAVDQLRIVVRGLHGLTLPTQVCAERDDFREHSTGSNYVLVSSDIRLRVSILCKELEHFCLLMNGFRSGFGKRD